MSRDLAERFHDRVEARLMPNKRLQLTLLPIGERPLLCDRVSSLQMVTSRFSLCSVDPRIPAGRS